MTKTVRFSLPDGKSSCGWPGKSTSFWFHPILQSPRQNKYFRVSSKKYSNCTSETSSSLSSSSLLLKSVTNLSNPWEILTHEWDLSLLVVVTSKTGPIFVFPRTQPFKSDDFSSLGKMYSRQTTDSVKCENCSVSFVMEYCPTSTSRILHWITLYCCQNLSTISWHLRSRSYCATSSIERDVFIDDLVGANNGSHYPAKSPRSQMAGCAFHTELIHRNNCSVNSFNRVSIGTTVCGKISTTFFFSALLVVTDSWIGRLGVRNRRVQSSSAPWLYPVLLVVFLHL